MEFIRPPRNAPRLDDGPHAERTDMGHRSSSVTVTDINMPFMSMVTFMVKWALASIPAFLILGAGWLLVVFLVSGALRGGRP